MRLIKKPAPVQVVKPVAPKSPVTAKSPVQTKAAELLARARKKAVVNSVKPASTEEKPKKAQEKPEEVKLPSILEVFGLNGKDRDVEERLTTLVQNNYIDKQKLKELEEATKAANKQIAEICKAFGANNGIKVGPIGVTITPGTRKKMVKERVLKHMTVDEFEACFEEGDEFDTITYTYAKPA